jgi:hypothetical protein
VRKWLVYLPVCFLLSVAVLELGAKLLMRKYPILRFALFTDLDHRNKPNQSRDINGDGLRSALEADQIAAEDYNIILLGDSYVFGVLLQPHTTISARLEKILRKERSPQQAVNVINFGWVSSSPFLSLRLLRDVGEKYKPDAVILCVDMTDFRDDLFYRLAMEGRRAFKVTKHLPATGFLIWKIVRLSPWSETLFPRLYGMPKAIYFPTLMPLEESEEYFWSIRQSILEIAQFTASELRAKFSLVVLPRHFQYNGKEAPQDWAKDLPHMQYEIGGPYVEEPFRYFERFSREVDFPVIPLLDDFKDPSLFPTTFKKDSHYNARGAQFAAQFIATHCHAKGCFPGLKP